MIFCGAGTPGLGPKRGEEGEIGFWAEWLSDGRGQRFRK